MPLTPYAKGLVHRATNKTTQVARRLEIAFANGRNSPFDKLTNPLERRGFVIRQCQTAQEIMDLFAVPPQERPEFLVVNARIPLGYEDIEPPTFKHEGEEEVDNSGSLGEKLYLYLRYYNPQLKVIIHTDDDQELKLLHSLRERRLEVCNSMYTTMVQFLAIVSRLVAAEKFNQH